MISRFWKKNTVFNIGLLIIFLRIYGFIIHFLNKFSENIVIFPKVGENGYPFEESMQYNLDDISKITELLKKNQSVEKPIILFTPNKCTFFGKINMCKSNDNCYNEINKIKEGKFIYHENEYINNKIILTNDYILNLLQEQNKFMSKLNIEKELPFYYKIIDGYSSYISILSNDIDSIKIISKSEEKINNLMFLYILYLKAYISNYKINNALDIKKVLQKSEKNIIHEISSMDESSIGQLINILDIKIKDEIISCIPDLDKRYSFLIDFQSLLAIIKITFEIKPNNYELKLIDFPFMKLSGALIYLFYLDNQAKKRNFIISLILKYIGFIYWPISAIQIYYLNKYFIRKKEFYSENKISNNKLIDKPKYNKLLKYKRNIEMIQKINKSKYTKEEIDMINKLTKDQKDFIVSK